MSGSESWTDPVNILRKAYAQVRDTLSSQLILEKMCALYGTKTEEETCRSMFWDSGLIRKYPVPYEYAPHRGPISESCLDLIEDGLLCSLLPYWLSPSLVRRSKKRSFDSVVECLRRSHVADIKAWRRRLQHTTLYCRFVFLICQKEKNRSDFVHTTPFRVSAEQSDCSSADDFAEDCDSSMKTPSTSSSSLITPTLSGTRRSAVLALMGNDDPESKLSVVDVVFCFLDVCADLQMQFEIMQFDDWDKDAVDCVKLLMCEVCDCMKWSLLLLKVLMKDDWVRMAVADANVCSSSHLVSLKVVVVPKLVHASVAFHRLLSKWRTADRYMADIRVLYSVTQAVSKATPFPRHIFDSVKQRSLTDLLAITLFTAQRRTDPRELDLSATSGGCSERMRLMEVMHSHCSAVLSRLPQRVTEAAFMGYKRSEKQLLWKCSDCRTLRVGLPFFVRYCKKCGASMHDLEFASKLPWDVSPKQFVANYRRILVAQRAYCDCLLHAAPYTGTSGEELTARGVPDSIIGLIASFLDFSLQRHQLVDVRDELGNWLLARVKSNTRESHLVLISYQTLSDRWNEWIDSRSLRIEHPFTHTTHS